MKHGISVVFAILNYRSNHELQAIIALNCGLTALADRMTAATKCKDGHKCSFRGRNLRHLPMQQQIQAYRNMVADQTAEEHVLSGAASVVGLTKLLLSKHTDEERMGIAAYADEMATRTGTACVSYVGKANFGESEKYIQEFHLWSYHSLPITIQISAVNGKFTFDFIQKFHSPIYVNAFLKELDENGISYDFQAGMREKLPNIVLPWNQEQSLESQDSRKR